MEPYLPQSLINVVVEYLVPPVVNTDCTVCQECYNECGKARIAFDVMERYLGRSLGSTGLRECYYCEDCEKVYTRVRMHNRCCLHRGSIDKFECAGKIIVGTPTFRNMLEFLGMHKYIRFHWTYDLIDNLEWPIFLK